MERYARKIEIRDIFVDGSDVPFEPLSSQKKESRKKLKENIIKAFFIDKKSIVTEVTFTYQGKYSVGSINKQDIKNMVFEINQSKKYNPINIFTNSYGVLSLQLI